MKYELELPFMALVRRELLRSMRARYLAGVFMLLCGLGSVLLIPLWPDGDLPLIALGAVSVSVTGVFAVIAAAAAVLLLPGLAAGTLAEERDQETYDLMRMTLIRPVGILAGKFLNCIGAFLLLLIGAMPLLATTYFLVGTNWDVLLRIFFIVATSSITCVAIGLACSARYRSPLPSIIASYLLCAFMMGGYVLLFYFFFLLWFLVGDADYVNVRAGATLSSVFATTPLGNLISVLAGGVIVPKLWGMACIQTVASIIALIVAWRGLCSPQGEQSVASPPASRVRRPLLPIFACREWPPIPDRGNPIFVRECRHIRLLQNVPRWRRVVVYTALVIVSLTLLLGLMYVSQYPNWQDDLIGLCLQVTFVTAVALIPPIAATSFVREEERNTKDLLTMTLLTHQEIVSGKIMYSVVGLFRVLSLFLLATWPFLSVFAFTANPSKATLFAGVYTVITVASALFVSMIASMSAKRTATSVPLAYGLCAAMFFGPTFTILAVADYLRRYGVHTDFEEFALLLSPIAYALENIDSVAYGKAADAEWPAVTLLHTLVAFVLFATAIRFAGTYWMRRSNRLHL
ncbi:MAG: hypothetical protein K1Y02_04495 [Candidatus Hydrogenedentes bacterium]|nr:hypothetical protein [Candidatus Hydrogenedentota bacterium]